MPRVVEESSNLSLILRYREEDIDFSSISKIQDYLRDQFNLNASERSINEAMGLRRSEERARLVKRVILQNLVKPFPKEVRVLDLLKTDLFWIESGSKLWIVSEALARLGYSRKNDKEGFAVWIKKDPD